MKRTIKTYIKLFIFLFGISLLLINCEREENLNIENTNQEKTVSKIKRISFDAFKSKNSLTKEISLIKKYFDINNKNEGQFSRSVENGFTIITEEVITVTYDSVTTYTFQVEPINNIEGFQNFVIKKTPSISEYFLVYYTYTADANSLFNSLDILSEEDLVLNDIDLTSRADLLTQEEDTSGGGNGCAIISVEPCSSGGVNPHTPVCQHIDPLTNQLLHNYECDFVCTGTSISIDYSGCQGYDPIVNNPPSGSGDTGNSSGGGGGTPAGETGSIETVPIPLINADGSFVAPQGIIDNLNITDQNQLDWINDIANIDNVNASWIFGQSNNWSNEVSDFVFSQIELGQITSTITLSPQVGFLNGRADQKYTHKGTDAIYNYYRMEDGSSVIKSPTELSLNSSGNLVSRFTSESDNNYYWYIKPPETNLWSNYLIKETNSDLYGDLETLFILGVEDLALTIGTYVVPAEEIKILFTGTDFNGEPTSQWLAAGMLFIEIVPGGKLVKAVKFVPAGALKWGKMAAKVGGGQIKLIFETIDGILHFGNRSQLRQVLGLTVGDARQAHHIIPWAKQTKNIVQLAAKDPRAFHMNEAINGIPLETTVHLGSHPNYDNKVLQKFIDLNNAYPNITPEQAYDGLTNIINSIRTAILNNPNTHIDDLIF